MEVTEEMRRVMDGMLQSGVEEEVIPYLMLMLEKPEQVKMMLEYITENTMRDGRVSLTREDILEKAVQISPQPKPSATK